MVFTLSIVDTLFSMVRIWNYNGELCDRRCHRGVEAIDNHRGMDNVHLEHQNKRRKMQNSMCFKSQRVEKMINWLENDEITTIGVYGMGGIGKTTFAEQLHARLLNNLTFTDILAYISVGLEFTIYQLQDKIAKAFGLDIESDKDEIRRSGIIYAFLSRNNKFILILDDLWGDFRREDVGIPSKCKMVVISRSLNVCHILRCQKVIKIEPLSKEETWKLFQHSIGYSMLDDPKEVLHISKLVYEKCAGLPLAITVLANRMKCEDNVSRWKEVFESEDPFSMGQKSYLEDIFSQLKKSYTRLNNTKLQCCFLHAALYPKNWAISKEALINLWMGEGLIDDVRSLQVQYDMGHSILNKLLNTCLLETRQDKRSIKMNDFIRHMAISILGERFMVNRDIIPSKSYYVNLKGISQINSLISFPWNTHVKFTNLSILLLQHNHLEEIPESLFRNMRGLRVLSLSYTWITKLPCSISELKELQILGLNGCKRLKNIPLLEKLQKLRILDLSQTIIEQVLCSIVKMKGIMELNLPELKEIPIKVLHALPRLKKLSCLVSGNTNQELQTLELLEILDAKFENLYELHNYVNSQHWRALECFHLQVGEVINPKRPHTRAISLQGCSLRGRGEELFLLPYDIQELYLEDCRGFCSLSEIMNPANSYGFKQEADVFSSLEICTISRCHEVEKLFEPDWMQNLQSLELLEVKECAHLKELVYSCCEVKKDVANFPQLNQLILNSLPKLKSIHEGRLVCASLQSFTVINCPNLKRLPLCIEDIERLLPLSLEWIEGQQEWWDVLEWDKSESKDLLQPFFRCLSSNSCLLKNGHFL